MQSWLAAASLLAACALGSGVGGPADIASAEQGVASVVKLEPGNFAAVTGASPITYILFYEHKCRDCPAFNDAFLEAAERLQHEDLGTFAQIDNSVKNRKIFDAFGLDRDYPKLNVFCVYTLDEKKGPVMTRVNPWDTDTTADDIDAFAREYKAMYPSLWEADFDEELASLEAQEEEEEALAKAAARKRKGSRKGKGGHKGVSTAAPESAEKRYRKQQRKIKAKRAELMNKQLGACAARHCAGSIGRARAAVTAPIPPHPPLPSAQQSASSLLKVPFSEPCSPLSSVLLLAHLPPVSCVSLLGVEVLDENVDPEKNLAYERPTDASSQLAKATVKC